MAIDIDNNPSMVMEKLLKQKLIEYDVLFNFMTVMN